MLKSKLRLATVYIKVVQDQTHLALESRRHHYHSRSWHYQSGVTCLQNYPWNTIAEVAWTTATFCTKASYNLRLVTTIWPEMEIFHDVTVRKLSAPINAICTDDQDLNKVFHWEHEIICCSGFIFRVANPIVVNSVTLSTFSEGRMKLFGAEIFNNFLVAVVPEPDWKQRIRATYKPRQVVIRRCFPF